MENFTVFIYRFFQKHKIAFWTTLILSILFFAYYGSKIEYEEDVTKLLPPTEDGNNTNEVVFANLKVKDKMFILFKPQADSIDVSTIAEAVDTFMTYLDSNSVCQDLLDEVLYKFDGEMMKDGLADLYQNIPTFVDSLDYQLLDSLTTTEAIQQQMQENLMTIYSPAGAMMMDVIQKDPLAFRKIFMNKAGAIKSALGSNYQIVEHHFFSPDSAIAIAWLSPNFITFNSKLSNKLISEIDKEILKFNQVYPDIEVYYHGSAPQSMFNSKQIKSDLRLTLSVSMIIICLIFLICYRDPKMILKMLVPIGYGFIFALAVIYFIKGSISLLALGIGAIVLGVALSYCLHIIIHQKHVTDPVRVLKEQTLPVILGCLTTIGAFLSLLFTRAELLKDFGIFASLALVGTTLFCLIFLPQFFGKERIEPSTKAAKIIKKINTYPFERKTILIIAILFISIVSFIASDYVKFDANLKHISHYEPRVMESQRILAEHTTKEYQTVYFATASNDIDTALYYNRKLSNIFEALEELGKIGPHATGSEQFFLLQSEQKERIDAWNNYWTDGKKKQVLSDMDKAAIACGFNPDSFYTFRQIIESTNYMPFSLYDTKAIPDAIKCNLIEYTDGKYLVFTPILVKEENKKEVCDDVTSYDHVVVIDPFYYTSDMLKLIHNDFNVTLLISSIFVLIVLLIAYRSIILAFIAFMPMTISWYIVLGVMTILGIQFNLINIIISSLIYGVGVDYSIFVMDGLLTDYRTKKSLLVFHKTAILFSAMVLIITVTSLLFAHHPSIHSIGISTIIGMSSSVLLAYSLQPFLFYWLIKRQVSKGKAPITLFNILHGDIYFNSAKEMSNKQQIRNLYEYKGEEVEKAIKRELKETHNYKMLNDILPLIGKSINTILDYSCQYGVLAYWFHINNKEAHIVGFDRDEYAITIATNCYSRDGHIKFTTNDDVLDGKYDLIVVHNSEQINSSLTECLNDAKIIILHKEMDGKINIPVHFRKSAEDNLFILYKA